MFSSKSEKTVKSKASVSAAPSIISAGLTVTGDLKTTGELQVDGEIVGDLSAGKLTIGDTARIHGAVNCEEVLVRGEVEGRIAAHKVHIAKSAHVHGDVFHEELTVEGGAVVDGRMRHCTDPREVALSPDDTAQPAPDEPPRQPAKGDGAVFELASKRKFPPPEGK
jgi:cytoskeletal protein CcmA (bactofilin family)